MKPIHSILRLVVFLIVLSGYSQNVSVSQNTFSDQELIEDVLFSSNCVSNISFQSATSGNFSNGESSYGYFQSNNSGFPFEEGIVLTTGRLSNVPGPNNTLSDDDAPNWNGDIDLENALGISNTINATVLEFSFVPQAGSINFRYIFASEEYRENNPSTCNFSDAFAFLIRPIGGQYENLALIPGTNIPVQVTTVRPEIPGECPAVNEEYFGQFNGVFAPINFNGQTAILTAETDVLPGQTYEVKLVIADETNFRFDSAVFLEANSFNAGVDLGTDLTLCQNETTTLDIDNQNGNPVRWFYNDQLFNTTDNSIIVTEDNFGAGTYRVELDLPSGCTAEDSIVVNFDDISIPDDLEVTTCLDDLGFGTFNLQDVSSQLDGGLQILDFYNSIENAENDTNPIQNPTSYTNQVQDEVVFVKVLNQNNCTAIGAVLLLGGAASEFDPVIVTVCPVQETSPTSFSNILVRTQIADVFGVNPGDVDLFFSEEDALAQINEINSGFIEIETDLLPLTLIGRLSQDNSCLGLVPIVLQKLEAPEFISQQTNFLICENLNDQVVLDGAVLNPTGTILYDWSTGETTQTISVSQAGSYTVDITSIQIIDNQEVICVNSQTYTVVSSSIAEVTFIQNGFAGGNSQVVILAEGLGDYEYALNDFNYLDTNTFDVVTTENTIRVRDKNGCGVVELDFNVLEIPDFFTPNGDGFNDFWQIKSIRQTENDIKHVNIFDRYGKLISQIYPTQIGWDGNYKGHPMPSQDYWYSIVLFSGQNITGHFTLKR